jgi:beta-galactosidase/beta-glucuronidase
MTQRVVLALFVLVLDEANIEAHHYGNDVNNWLTSDPAWLPLFLDRVQRMI